MQFANKHFDFNARHIQLPPLTSPLTTTFSNDEWHLWVAARTLLSLQHHGDSTHDHSAVPSPDFDIQTSDSSLSQASLTSSDAYREEDSSNDSSNKRQSTDEDDSIPVRTTSTSGVTKPRWSDQERSRLVQAVIQEKKLNISKSFQWHRIATAVPYHSIQSCQDQWFNEMLPLMNELYQSD